MLFGGCRVKQIIGFSRREVGCACRPSAADTELTQSGAAHSPLPSKFIKEDDGAILPFVAMASPIFILCLALVVDLGLGRLTANKLQVTADAAALAGAAVLPFQADVDAEAIDFAQKNYDTDNGNTQPVLNPNDILIGNWNSDTRVFTTGGVPINAVQVTTRRDATNANRLPSVFAGIAGIDFLSISKTAIAVNGAGIEFPCIGGGILSNEDVIGQSDNVWNNFCIYGDIEVGIQSDNDINEGSVFAMPDASDYYEGSDNDYFDRDEQVISDVWDLPNLDNVEGYIDAAQAGNLPPDIPFTINNVITTGDIDADDTLQSDTLYIVNGDVDFGSNQNVSNVAIVADGDINLGSNSTIENAVLMSEDQITFQSDNRIGLVSPCTAGGGFFNMYVFAEDNVEFQSDNDIFGVQVATLGELVIQTDNTVVGLYGEADERATMQSNGVYGTCENGLGSAFGPLTGAFVPGDNSLVLVD